MRCAWSKRKYYWMDFVHNFLSNQKLKFNSSFIITKFNFATNKLITIIHSLLNTLDLFLNVIITTPIILKCYYLILWLPSETLTYNYSSTPGLLCIDSDRIGNNGIECTIWGDTYLYKCPVHILQAIIRLQTPANLFILALI